MIRFGVRSDAAAHDGLPSRIFTTLLGVGLDDIDGSLRSAPGQRDPSDDGTSTRRCQTRRAVWRCFLGAERSASSQPSIVAFHGSSTGDTRGGLGFRGAGTGEASASRTVRRCVLNRRASPRPERPSRSRVLRICSNMSTFDLVVMHHTVKPAIPRVVDPRRHEVPPGGWAKSDARGSKVGPDQMSTPTGRLRTCGSSRFVTQASQVLRGCGTDRGQVGTQPPIRSGHRIHRQIA